VARILVLPGIGDIYWVAIALEDFCRKHGIEKPEVCVWDFDGRRRSEEYVQRIPFVTSGGYWEHTHKIPGFHESYMTGRKSVFPDFHGFDFYIAVNGALRVGRTVEQALPGIKTDWHFPILETSAEQVAGRMYQSLYGRYIVTHFSAFGMFSEWVKAWGLEGCSQAVARIEQETGLPVLLTGSSWDDAFASQIAARTGAVNLCGKTNTDQFFALFRNAAGCFGWCGGITILATYFKIPTLIVWSRYFRNAGFYQNACSPESRDQWYRWKVVEGCTPEQAATAFAEMIR
jgi:hypothetical protein